MTRRRPRVVLLSAHYPARNPYIGLLAESLAAAGTVVKYFGWSRAFFGRYHAFHLHWIESLYAHGGKVSRFIKRWLLRCLLITLKVRKIPVVMTVHNPGLHDPLSPSEHRLYDRIMRQVDTRIFMNPDGSDDWDHAAVIPHGHYRVALSMEPSSIEPGTEFRLLLFGQLRPYKNIEGLLEPFLEWDDPGAVLTLAGSARPASYANDLRSLASHDPRVSVIDAFLSDDELVSLVRRSHLVVLPYPEIYNSGALFFALSVGRPVLIRAGNEARRLVEEFGSAWVLTYEGALTPGDLASARARVAGEREDWPDMSARDWGVIADAHNRAYRDAYERMRTRQ